MAATWLNDAKSVADIGCGTMGLRDFLVPGMKYVAIDISQRDEHTIVVDLDTSDIPDTGAEAAAALGVIEYLDSVDRFLYQLNRFSFSVISYNHKSLKDILWTLRLRKKRVTWANHLSLRQFHRKIYRSGLRRVKSKRIRMGETLYYLAPNNV
jgi:hypothetical protein